MTSKPEPYVLRDRGIVFTFDPAAGTIVRTHRLWKSRHESWKCDRIHGVEIVRSMYKGAEWFAVQLCGVDTEDGLLEIPLMVGGRDERELMADVEQVSACLSIPIYRRNRWDPITARPSEAAADEARDITTNFALDWLGSVRRPPCATHQSRSVRTVQRGRLPPGKCGRARMARSVRLPDVSIAIVRLHTIDRSPTR